MKYKYFVPDHDETIEDAEDVYRWRFDYDKGEPVKKYEYAVDDHESAAEDAARVLYESLAGEWSDGTQTIVVMSADGKEETFDVEIEYTPNFSARKR